MRKATVEDWLDCRKAVDAMIEFAPRYPVPVQPNKSDMLAHFYDKLLAGDVYVGHGALLLVSVFTPWYGDERILQEELIVGIPGQQVFPRAVVDFIPVLARERECSYCLAGNTLQDPRLTTIYESRGFKHITDILFKETPHG